MYDGPTIVLLTLSVHKTLRNLLDTLDDMLSDNDVAARSFAAQCVNSGSEALLKVALARLRRWRDLWCIREQAEDVRSHHSDELLTLLWGSRAFIEIKRVLGLIQDDVAFVEGVLLKSARQHDRHTGSPLQLHKKDSPDAQIRTKPLNAVADLQDHVKRLCDRVQTLDPLTQVAFRSRSGPTASLDGSSNDIGYCYQRLSDKRREVRPFIDFCNKSELSLNIRLSACEGAGNSSAGPWSRLQHVLLILEGTGAPGGRRPPCFVVSQATAAHVDAFHGGHQAEQEDDEARLFNLMQGHHHRESSSCSIAQVEVQHHEQGFVVKECQHTATAIRPRRGQGHILFSRAQLPLVEGTTRLATSEKIEVACTLAYHASILLGSPWASCFNAWNLRRQESGPICWWKLHVHDDHVDIPSLEHSATAILRSQIADFGCLLLSLAVGRGAMSASDGLMGLARDVLPRVERSMGTKYSSACLFCLNAYAPPLISGDVDATDATADILKAFFKEVCLPLQRLRECLHDY